jgi:hypothetical protein
MFEAKIEAFYQDTQVGEISSLVAENQDIQLLWLSFNKENYTSKAGNSSDLQIEPLDIKIERPGLPTIELKRVQIVYKEDLSNNKPFNPAKVTHNNIITDKTYYGLYPLEIK